MILPSLRKLVISGMKAAYEGDPAAERYMEVLAAYPGPSAVLIQRAANCLYKLKIPILSGSMTEYACSMTGIDIHQGAEIGERFFIDYGTGVVIGETTIIGNYVKIYQGVTLEALSTCGGHKQRCMKRHPTVEDNETIYFRWKYSNWTGRCCRRECLGNEVCTAICKSISVSHELKIKKRMYKSESKTTEKL